MQAPLVNCKHAVSSEVETGDARTPVAAPPERLLAASLRSFPVGNYIVFYLPLPDGINVVRILNGYLDITAQDMD
jgi:toxin ParE1/3/4